jgi:hypothetical protein
LATLGWQFFRCGNLATVFRDNAAQPALFMFRGKTTTLRRPTREPGGAKAALRDPKLQISNGEFDICDLYFLA